MRKSKLGEYKQIKKIFVTLLTKLLERWSHLKRGNLVPNLLWLAIINKNGHIESYN